MRGTVKGFSGLSKPKQVAATGAVLLGAEFAAGGPRSGRGHQLHHFTIWSASSPQRQSYRGMFALPEQTTIID
jgi:hypothetical protein